VPFAYYARLSAARRRIYDRSDAKLYKLEETFHTEGFYKRESSLFHQLVSGPLPAKTT
jgi:hypothetical protein